MPAEAKWKNVCGFLSGAVYIKGWRLRRTQAKIDEPLKKISIMKLFNRVGRPVICGLALGVSALVSTAVAADTTNAPPKPDQLITCPVSGDKLGEMDKPYVFVFKGQEVKLCCAGCKKDFDKDPAKYLKLIRAADQNTSN